MRDVGLKCTTKKKDSNKKSKAWQKKRLIIRANNALEILLASLTGSVFRDQEFFFQRLCKGGYYLGGVERLENGFGIRLRADDPYFDFISFTKIKIKTQKKNRQKIENTKKKRKNQKKQLWSAETNAAILKCGQISKRYAIKRQHKCILKILFRVVFFLPPTPHSPLVLFLFLLLLLLLLLVLTAAADG